MNKHINLFETKSKEELLELYRQFLEAEKKLWYSRGFRIRENQIGIRKRFWCKYNIDVTNRADTYYF